MPPQILLKAIEYLTMSSSDVAATFIGKLITHLLLHLAYHCQGMFLRSIYDHRMSKLRYLNRDLRHKDWSTTGSVHSP